ncbi:AAA family ATPase [Nonomuraea sp. NPDC050790]|uniref:AAA family ATPase n=1 Tax=Nonomuraea sp. NPDC050790 TaxID=3364371 RepID=UPI0037BC611C
MSAGDALVGRDQQRNKILTLLGKERLVTITGAGGVGKSALARAVATAYDPAARVIDLDPSNVHETILSGERLPWDDGGPPRLLVLDTCDHVVDRCVALVERLLRGLPHLRVLVTGREVLGIPGEHVTAAGPLPQPDAATLFHVRSGGLRADPGVLARLEGLPLAIEIAAEHLLDSGKLAETLDDGTFHSLPAGPAHPARHASMRAAAAWSHRQCQPSDALAWERLAAFETPFGLEEAERALAGHRAGDAAEAVARLVERSIVLVDSAAVDGRWYRMPFHLRAFTK